MTAPFTYPSSSHRRRHGPRGYADHESYRPWLRDEFAFRCVYCLVRKRWGSLTGQYAIDHFIPVAFRPEKALDYGNLLYSCVACNLNKASQRTPDPTAVLLHPGAHVTADGVLHADSSAARRLIGVLDLNRPQLREYRELWIDIVRLAAASDAPLCRRLMGFPDDLPSLRRLRPPGGNTRPNGIGTSYHVQRQAGPLPAIY
jgi:hypothetical protein